MKDTIVALVEIHNLRAKIQMLKIEGEELSKYGPAKPLDKQGIDEFSETPVEKGPHYTMDPTGRRTGNGMCVYQGIALTYLPAAILCSIGGGLLRTCSMLT